MVVLLSNGEIIQLVWQLGGIVDPYASISK